jgi:hypothetical protein
VGSCGPDASGSQYKDLQRALMNTVMNFWVPLKCGEFLFVSFSRRTLFRGVSDKC